MEIIITINDKEEQTLLESLALENGKSVTQYATSILRGWLQNRIKNEYINYVQRSNIQDLVEKLGTTSQLQEVK